MLISAIVAVSKNGVIGKDNKMPWHLPADLKYFKKTTLHHHLIMGRKCYESIGRPLPKRVNIVVTRSKTYKAEGCIILNSLDAALEYAEKAGETEVFIAGGGQIYKQSMKKWDKLYLTEIDIEVEGDVFFPEMKWENWNLISSKEYLVSEQNSYTHSFKVYERKK